MPTSESENIADESGRLLIAAILGACFLIYGQVWWFEFINLDDNLYVYDNPFVRPGLNWISAGWAFTTFHSANWHPLTWLSHMADASIFGPRPGGHHFVNVLFHAANSLLSFFVFRQMTGDVWKSGIVALLFAIHPAHVESVAWVSERKDVLSTLFWLLTMLAYVRYVRAVGNGPVFKRFVSPAFLLVLVLFALSLMSKPMPVTLPFVLLLCDYWPLERLKRVRDFWKLTLEKLPMFVLSAASAIVTVMAQGSWGAIESTTGLPIDVRILNAIVSYSKYIGMLFYPANLGVGYAFELPVPWWQVGSSLLSLIGITVVCLWQRRSRKYLLFGWLWYVGTMVPVIGLVQVGAQSMADRYTYVPYFGLFVMLVWGLAEIAKRLDMRPAVIAAATAVPLLILTGVALKQVSHWKNSLSLYSHTVAVGQGNVVTMHNYCSALINFSRFAEAEEQCRRAIEIKPDFVDTYLLLGLIQMKTERSAEASVSFRKVLEMRPNDPMALNNIAVALTLSGETDEAEKTLKTLMQTFRERGLPPPNLVGAYANLATAFAGQRRYDKAADWFPLALEAEPGNIDMRASYAVVLEFAGRPADADLEIARALADDPNRAESRNAFGVILMNRDKRAEAKEQFEQALRLKPGLKDAQDNLDRLNSGKVIGR